MRSSIHALWLSLISTVGLHAADPQAIPPEPVDGNISWVYSYSEGKELGRKTGKPLFVVFRCEL